MSNLEAVTKVADQIITRIFDQRQFTGGEINYLAKELIEKIDLDGNFDRLLKINENVCLTQDSNREDLYSTYGETRKNICEQVSSLIERAESILCLEDKYRKQDELNLTVLRRDLDKKKSECVKDCDSKLDTLKEALLEENLELQNKYLKFEEKLRQDVRPAMDKE